MSWFGSIFDAKESGELTEGKDGNFSYPNGTYGQSDYTVREREDSTYDVYIKSDSSKGHSHDHIDRHGNIIDKYHDYIFNLSSNNKDKPLVRSLKK